MTDTPDPRSFAPVPVRRRHDGWTADRQTAFIEVLAESGCVTEACGRVGVSPQAAYALRRRVDAQSFRSAWDAALDYAIRRLSDAVIGRAINGVAVPHYYKGELVGEHRRYDERLASFLLRYRDPTRYGRALDAYLVRGPQEVAALDLARALDDLAADAHDAAAGVPPQPRAPRLTGLDAAELDGEPADGRPGDDAVDPDGDPRDYRNWARE